MPPELWTPPTSTAAGSPIRIEVSKPEKPQGHPFVFPGMTSSSWLGSYHYTEVMSPELFRVKGRGGYSSGPSSTSFTVSSLPSEEFDLLAPFILKIEEEEGEFLACFEEANIGMSGGTKEEAIENLLADILDTFALFSKEETNLGPEPARQLSVLRRYIQSNR